MYLLNQEKRKNENNPKQKMKYVLIKSREKKQRIKISKKKAIIKTKKERTNGTCRRSKM